MLVMTSHHHRVMLVIMLSRQLGRGVMTMTSHAADDAAKVSWPWRNVSEVLLEMMLPRPCWVWHDVIAESCWR
jgi:hypothetical protein